MQTLDAIKKRIKTTGDLLGVVKTMKSLAAVNIRHFEQAARALTEYDAVVRQGWTVLFRSGAVSLSPGKETRAVILAVGSDLGMCGQYNELATQAALELGGQLAQTGLPVAFWAVGYRVRNGLEDAGKNVDVHLALPGTLGGVDIVVGDLVRRMEAWHRGGAGQFHVVHNTQMEREGYAPLTRRILPLDKEWGRELAAAPWPGRCLPQTYLSTETLFAGLFEQHLFASLYAALAGSMAAENAARLAAMQAAEKNIEDMNAQLQGDFRQTRQNAITGELLDIVSGFEAMSEP